MGKQRYKKPRTKAQKAAVSRKISKLRDEGVKQDEAVARAHAHVMGPKRKARRKKRR